MVANYGGGSVATFRLESDGTLGEAACVHRQAGSSIDIHRQNSSHAHGVFVAPANQYVVVPDLGADLIYVYSLDANSAKLQPFCPATIPVEAGTGPRHFAFHPCGGFGYVIGELNSSIVGFRCSLDGASIRSFMNAPTTAREFYGENIASEIAIDRGGRFLYCSNRGADDIGVFAIGLDGELSPRQRIGSGGRTPRHFALDPTERFILVANQDSDNVAVFSRNRATGLLNDTGRRMQVSQPACLAFAARAG
jgi:6-phosphogluconolactonase